LLSSSLSQIRPELVYASPANQKTKGQNTQRCMSVLIAISYSPSTMAVFFSQAPAGTGHDFATVRPTSAVFFFSLAPTAHNNFATVRPMLAVFFFFKVQPPPTIYTRVLRSEDI
jgi:hypothetical protein